jgi:hypothetical protein
MRLLALNSEHLMRRIACECDFTGEHRHLIDLYNEGIGKSIVKDTGLDKPYELGSVEKLGYVLFVDLKCLSSFHILRFGVAHTFARYTKYATFLLLVVSYGVDKFVLLRVGPFPDIYENLALGHAKKSDESSALISAEAANNKVSGFASTFLFYAKLLNSFPNREEEARDAARMCLRLPLPSIGLTVDDFREVAVLAQLADRSDSDEEIMAKLQSMYEKMREHESDDPQSAGSHKMTPEQKVIDEANYILDTVALTGAKWSKVRPQLADLYRSVGRDDMANFVNPKTS